VGKKVPGGVKAHVRLYVRKKVSEDARGWVGEDKSGCEREGVYASECTATYVLTLHGPAGRLACSPVDVGRVGARAAG
jgi:hypothetical protein